MTLSHLVHLALPQFRLLTTAIEEIPLKARSLLIKQCQAQYDVPEVNPVPTPTIIYLLESHPPVVFNYRSALTIVKLRDFFRHFGTSVEDPVQSALILDFLRGLPVSTLDRNSFRRDGWVKEIKLGWDRKTPQVNFRPFFFQSSDPIHPLLPHNITNLFRIRNKLRGFRDRLVRDSPRWFPRATHKNMSRSTRRSYEENFPGSMLDNSAIPIFGQDDWQRVYHETGDTAVGNSNERVLLERLGYVEKKRRRIHLSVEDSYNFLVMIFEKARMVPAVYEYTVLNDVPECFHFD